MAAYERWNASWESQPAETFTDLFLERSDGRDEPWAACVDPMDAHFPYPPAPEYDRWGGERLRELHQDIPQGPLAYEFLGDRPWWQLQALEALYDGTIYQLDAVLRPLFRELRSRGEFDDTLIVVTSDHGEGSGSRADSTRGFACAATRGVSASRSCTSR